MGNFKVHLTISYLIIRNIFLDALITLKRWDTILKASDELKNFDYVLFLDADTRVVSEVSEIDLLTEKKYIGVHHPCHYLGMTPHNKYPGAFETREDSTAGIVEGDDTSVYFKDVCGVVKFLMFSIWYESLTREP